MRPFFDLLRPSRSLAFQSPIVESAKGCMEAFVCRRGWRSHRQATSVVCGWISSRPNTVARIPAMWKVLEEACGGWFE